MSGGFFQYNQWLLTDMADKIDEVIINNISTAKNEYGEDVSLHLGYEVIEKFKETSHCVRRAAEMLQRVDWLLSGDDGEETFLERWDKEVRK